MCIISSTPTIKFLYNFIAVCTHVETNISVTKLFYQYYLCDYLLFILLYSREMYDMIMENIDIFLMD